ncbi:hypothetical protein GQ55_7G210300 [Panicum hallii var. hallii]|uniref:Uncharacterized protein n=1 Tax=Panicum hallii var. hallii TaxID=1504633 RepID=A0A2T7CXF3_9POAL|nr:hypothetical protein GQ55_7G210300 [Panicum hallii var. hallii]
MRKRRTSGSPLARAADAGQERAAASNRERAGSRGRWPGQNWGLFFKYLDRIFTHTP